MQFITLRLLNRSNHPNYLVQSVAQKRSSSGAWLRSQLITTWKSRMSCGLPSNAPPSTQLTPTNLGEHVAQNNTARLRTGRSQNIMSASFAANPSQKLFVPRCTEPLAENFLIIDVVKNGSHWESKYHKNKIEACYPMKDHGLAWDVPPHEKIRITKRTQRILLSH